MFDSNERNAKDMSFRVSELIDVIKKNRDKHVKDYAEAVSDYKGKLLQVLNAKVQDISNSLKSEDVPSGHVSVEAPVSHVEEYDQYLEMLEMCQDEIVPLSMAMFNQLVRDKWSWKKGFDSLKTSYLNR